MAFISYGKDGIAPYFHVDPRKPEVLSVCCGLDVWAEGKDFDLRL